MALRAGSEWSDCQAQGYKAGTHVTNPFQLRLNACRVLPARGRDGTAACAPPIRDLHEATAGLQECSVQVLDPRT
jgi:hypothetical protein